MKEAQNVRHKRRAGTLLRALLDTLAALTPNRAKRATLAPRTIALSLYWGVGDAMQMLPLLQTVRSLYPHARITALGKPWLADLLGDQGLFDEIVEIVPPWTRPTGKYRFWDAHWRGFLRRAMALRRTPFDLFVSVRPDPREALVAKLLKARAFAGLAGMGARDWMAIDLGEGLADLYNLAGGAVAAHAASRLSGRDISPVYRLAALDRDPLADVPRPVLAVSFGASHPIRRWNGPAISRVLAGLKTRPGTLLLIEHDDSPEIPVPAGWTARRWRGDLTALRAVLAGADLLFCTDSGVMHIGAATGCKVMALFTSGNISRFAPPGQTIYRVEPMPCRPCGDHCLYASPLCVDRIDEAAVTRLLDDALAGQGFA